MSVGIAEFMAGEGPLSRHLYLTKARKLSDYALMSLGMKLCSRNPAVIDYPKSYSRVFGQKGALVHAQTKTFTKVKPDVWEWLQLGIREALDGLPSHLWFEADIELSLADVIQRQIGIFRDYLLRRNGDQIDVLLDALYELDEREALFGYAPGDTGLVEPPADLEERFWGWVLDDKSLYELSDRLFAYEPRAKVKTAVPGTPNFSFATTVVSEIVASV